MILHAIIFTIMFSFSTNRHKVSLSRILKSKTRKVKYDDK